MSGSKNWTDVRQFNLMYSTQMSATDGDNKIYLRPETAQGIFVNYLNVQKTGRMKLPFGIAQTGKAFRNEIVARQFIMRMKEFEQMEMQFFVSPGEEIKWYHPKKFIVQYSPTPIDVIITAFIQRMDLRIIKTYRSVMHNSMVITSNLIML